MSESLDLRGAKILIVDDMPAVLEVLRRVLENAGYLALVATSGEEALRLAVEERPDLVLLDVLLPDLNGFEVCGRLKEEPLTRAIPVVFLTAQPETEEVIKGFRAGGVDYIIKPFQGEEVLVRIHTHLEKARLIQVLMEKSRALEEEMTRREQLTRERNHLSEHLSLVSEREAERWGIAGLVGQSRSMQRILEEIDLLHQAPTTAVLICGESGTGKELVARALHFGGGRAEGPFVPVNCAAIPGELAESLLFGHTSGAFTGAGAYRSGYFELAKGGTLFLDEVGDLPLGLQPKLLRVLEDGRIRPVGGMEEKTVEVRVVAATNTDLQQQIQAGRFRQDLYFRLARFTVQTPPLRQRREDHPVLARHFLTLFAREMKLEPPPLSPAALSALEHHDFPGNVRELKNIVERALLESRGAQIQPGHLHFAPAFPAQGQLPAALNGAGLGTLPAGLDQALAQTEITLIRNALAQTGENVAAAARLLDTNRNRIYRALGKQPDDL
ncbi:MAG: sigma-54-dependent Fis family transcriptional regulator [Candidatus Latescibacteria bacterium]|nr:sigma-54-dependent Fis family transcriptional regulator [Candidatus Latescibacterota bacterium]